MNKRRRHENNYINLKDDNNYLENTNVLLIDGHHDDGGDKHKHNYNYQKSGNRTTEDEKYERSDIRGDKGNIGLLFFLYLLQGIPLGLTAAIPMLLQNRGASYKQQAEFSFAYWPFSLKLLWAPIVDALYWQQFGRRKSWLIPTQYLIGIFMLVLSVHVNRWLGGNGDSPNIQLLTIIFFALNFLAATQDIAVDGWALTMLKRCNVGHASTCNSVGQTAGYFLGYVVFIALESAEFCNSYLRKVPTTDGILTLPGFLWFWGLCFLVTTTIVAIFKREQTQQQQRQRQPNYRKHNSIIDSSTTDDILRDNTNDNTNNNDELNITQTYKLLWNIIKMRPIQILALMLLTVKLTFAACDAVTSLKLIDAGVPKDKLALLVVPLVPLQIILPLIISKYTTGPQPMDVYIKAIPYRICFANLAAVIVWLTPLLIVNGEVPIYYYCILLINYGFYQICLYSMFVAVMAFFARISDATVGGTYMTLLNTICNLGNNWPSTTVLWLVDVLTWRQCVNPLATNLFQQHGDDGVIEMINLNSNNTCSNKIEQDECTTAGGTCEIQIDGFYIECLICLIYGILWFSWGKTQIRKLQSMPSSVWRINSQHQNKHKIDLDYKKIDR